MFDDRASSLLMDVADAIFRLEILPGYPAIVMWVLVAFIFFTLRFGCINFSMFSHALAILMGKNVGDTHCGQTTAAGGYISHFQAFATALSGTVGLGTISGVAIAVSIGGPGSLFWMFMTGLLGMSCKFAEVFLGFKYRSRRQGSVNGGPFYYIEEGLAELNFRRLGRFTAIFCAALMIPAMMGGIAFQANQSIIMARGHFEFLDDHFWILAAFFAILVWAVVAGSLGRIAKFTSKLVPVMVNVHILLCAFIIIGYSDRFWQVLILIGDGIIDDNAGLGGVTGAFITGIRRGIFSSEVMVGTAPIAHAATDDKNPVRSGLVSMLEPCVDTMLVCFLTGFALLIVGHDHHVVGQGIVAVKETFSRISPVLGWILAVEAPLFGFSTILSYAYYCEVSWYYLFKRYAFCVHCLVAVTVLASSVSTNVIAIAGFSDALFMLLTVPNIAVIYLLSNSIARELRNYREALHGVGNDKKDPAIFDGG